MAVTRDQEFVDIVMRTTAIGRPSLTLAHEIWLPEGGRAAEGQTVVAWDRDRRCSRAISDDERQTLFNETRG
jgi:acyl-CoA thioesterase FadM